MSFNLEDYLDERKKLVNRSLRKYFPPEKARTKLHESIIYTLHSNGKRLRPILCLAAAELVSGSYEKALPAACAVEMIHTYSLIHDDLPSMDDDDVRREKPSNHVVFGEATAILAGDALLTDAFGIIAEESLSAGADPLVVLRVISAVSDAAGSKGMVAGQRMDLETKGRGGNLSSEKITCVHTMKTAKMFRAAVASGAMLAGADKKQLSSLGGFAEKTGLAFQMKDDVLDAEGNIEDLNARVTELTASAVSELRDFTRTPNELREIAVWLGERKH